MLLAVLGCASLFMCLPAWLRWGVVVDTCPAGRPVPTTWVEASSLRRGVWREVTVGATAHYTPGEADQDWTTDVRHPDVDLVLLQPDGHEVPLPTRKGWKRSWGHSRTAQVQLPADLPDGDYLLKASTDSRLGPSTTQAKLPLYAPARIHVLTDRPLYEPGNVVQFRALVLRAADLSPLEQRPGTWTVRDPSGEVLLEERAPAGAWGVVAGSFPLDSQAESGDWTVAWESGGASGAATIRVAPFTLPRFHVEGRADRSWYGPGDRPVVTGRVVYASGAPVPAAVLSLDWGSSGAWPPPTAWTDGSPGGLPIMATTDEGGAFRLALPPIPTDLQGQVTLSARVEAVDPAGDRVTGAVSVLLSADPIQVQAVTDLGEGLVEGFNNRLYLRATTADGQPLGNTDLVVRRAWDRTDPGQAARTDADGVAALQVDPGPAVNVVVPPMPVRPPPRQPGLSTPSTADLLGSRTVALLDQRSLDAWTSSLEPCSRFLPEDQGRASLVLRVQPDGSLLPFSPDGPVARCIAGQLQARRLPAGGDRLLQVSWSVDATALPRLSLSSRGWPTVPDDIGEQLSLAARDARVCLPEDAGATSLPRRLEWRTHSGERSVATRWLPRGRSDLSAAAVACVESHLAALGLDEPATADGIGIVELDLRPAPRQELSRPQATTELGYELAVAAHAADGEDLGSTTLRMRPGAVPTVRLRATPILPARGQVLSVELLRGPDFSGELPEKLVLSHQSGSAQVADLDPKTRTATFDLPDDKEGWFTVSWAGAVARVFVRPAGSLAVQLQPDHDRYAPGDVATLTVRTLLGARPGPAAVGLVGVDSTLGQLVTLPGPDALESLRDPVTTETPAFGSLDGEALALGRIQGDNAAAATVLRVSSIPSPVATDTDVAVSDHGSFDPVAGLTDGFYIVLGELYTQTRSWEQQAPKDEQMSNPTMAKLWTASVKACAARGEGVLDAYGRPLRLSWLPQDLLALTDPRVVVVDATRLPEDVVGWSGWVAEEEP